MEIFAQREFALPTVTAPPRTYARWVFGLILIMCSVAALPAAAPMVKTQPGFYRVMLGDFEITTLNDGVVAYATARVLPTATSEQIKSGLSEAALTDPVGMSYNAFLINTGSKLVLIDTGTGGKLDDQPEFHGAGHLLANLRAAGYRPEQVDEIYITHRGQDHIGGLTIGHERDFRMPFFGRRGANLISSSTRRSPLACWPSRTTMRT